MGFKVAWTACKGKSLDRMVADLRLKRTGAVESEPEAEYCGLTLPGDWSLVLNNFGDDGKVLLSEPLERVRAGCDGVCAYINDTSMMSLIYGFSGDLDTWSVLHDAEQGTSDFVIKGEPPPQFMAIRLELLRRQTAAGDANVDHLFEMAAVLGQALTGFRHDEDAPEPFVVLRRAKLFGLL